MAEAYCVKCKAKKQIHKPQPVTMKNGRRAVQGMCPDCGTKLFGIGGGEIQGLTRPLPTNRPHPPAAVHR